MKERHIDICTQLIPATLDGSKTQTRRVVKLQGSGIEDWYHRPDGLWQALHLPKGKGVGICAPIKCPYGKVGDRLWVRETFHIDSPSIDMPIEKEIAIINYKADSNKEALKNCNLKWKSPIHMPRWASRITLEITDIRVERLQEIPHKDIEAEGFYMDSRERVNLPGRPQIAFNQFKKLWNSLAKKGFKWEDNRWVWVIGFRRVK